MSILDNQINFKMETKKKEYIDNIINKLGKEYEINRGEVLYFITTYFDENSSNKIKTTIDNYNLYKKKLMELLEEINMAQKQFIQYDKDKFLKYDKELSKWVPINWGMGNSKEYRIKLKGG